MLRFLFIVLLMAPAALASAQFTYRLDQSIPVQAGAKTLSLPWAGGINAAQFNEIDLDGDGDNDVVIFEKFANVLRTYINDNKVLRYAPEFERLFPAEVDKWMLLRDFNHDGRKDIFTHHLFGIAIFVNITTAGGPLRWRPYNNGEALYTQGYTSPINLQLNDTDVPGIDDVDGDGDLDILDARFAGIGTIEYHKNMSKELTGGYDSLQMVRITQTWGNFEECNCGEYLFDGSSCAVFNGRTLHASGKSILTVDVDNDGDHDLFFTEENCDRIYFLENFGNSSDASMTGYTSYPSVFPIEGFPLFPAIYFEDADFDGVRDFVVGTNTYFRSSDAIDYQHSVWFYKNTGTDQLPVFSFVKKNYLQDEMIDVGDNAVPAFIDGDGDGDLDLYISSYNSPATHSKLYYYENVGTSRDPSFKFITDDFATISRFGLYNLKIQFADINADGRSDLVFTATDPASATTALYYIPNTRSDRLDIGNVSIVNTGFEINTGENILISDVNQDGEADILLGTSVGALQYWENQGGPGPLNFQLADDSYLGLGITTERQSPIVSVADLNGDGRTDLMLGDQRGTVTIYSDFRSDAPSGTSNILWDTLTQTYIAKNLGGRIWPTTANLFLDSRPAIITGNALGGLAVLKSDSNEALPEEAMIDIWPNPATAEKRFYIRADRNILVTMYSVLGVRMTDPFTVPAYEKYTVSSPGLSAGIYILRLSTGSKTISHRIIIP